MMKARLLGEKISDFFKEYRYALLYAFIICSLMYLICFLYTLIVVIVYILVNLYLLCDLLLYSPEFPADSRKVVDSPEKYNMKDFETNFIITEDKLSLNYYFFRKPNIEERLKVATIVYLHGNAGNIGHRLDNAIEMYQFLNVNVLIFDYRGYGLSSGKPSEKGLRLDAISVLQFIHNRTDINSRMVYLFGRSLGGAVAISATHEIIKNPKYRRLKPAGLIIENTFTSVPDVARKISHEQMNPLIAWLIYIMPSWFYRSKFDSRSKIKAIDLPFLFLSGLKDELLPASMMEDLHNTASSPQKRIVHFVSGTHNFTWRSPNYYSTIDSFLISLRNEQMSTAISRSSSSISILIDDLERSPLIKNEDGPWRMFCNSEKI